MYRGSNTSAFIEFIKQAEEEIYIGLAEHVIAFSQQV